MKRQLHDIIEDILSPLTYTITYDLAVDNSDGTYTLSGICDILHLQPDFRITIGSDVFLIKDYEADGKKWKIILYAQNPATSNTNNLPTFPSSFDLKKPFFCHGTPAAKEKENAGLSPVEKQPMIYLMEPYKLRGPQEYDSAFTASTDSRLCFLTEANLELETDRLYHNAVEPMTRLKDYILEALKDSGLFYNDGITEDVTNHAKFGINVNDFGTKKSFMTDSLSGLSCGLHLDIYEDVDCCSD